ncbi:PhoX family protein [Caldimonas sp.]|uniref:PhoX family protein n=1 Tax=Caldimonas sp. TaxID=2838790 RepID=UPI00391D2A8F
MNKPIDLPAESFVDPDDQVNNHSPNPSFDAVLNARLSRRGVLRAGLGSAATALFGGLSLSACGGGGDDDGDQPPAETLLGFTAVAKSTADTVTVPAGYTATVLYALGDPLTADTPAFRNDGTDTGYDRRAGDCHDGMEYFGLSASGQPDPTNNDRALLGINHEYVIPTFLHPNGPSPLPRPAGEVDIEVDCHGVSIVEIRKNAAGVFRYVQDSAFNRRVTAATEIEISGPARGHALLRTLYSPEGTRTRGTLNNCGTGKTPWGTLLTGEENWSGYFFRAAGDNTASDAKRNVALARYGRNVTATSAAASRYGWQTGGSDDQYVRWNTSITAASADLDYRNEINGQGYITEIDPYDRTVAVKKRTALGRFAHESAAFSRPIVGQPLAVYMGDDAQREYVYKFVSEAVWSAADANPADRIATGDKYLDAGTLYVARFNEDGTGQWLPLTITNPDIAGYATYSFADEGDVAIHSRLAADAVGATKMDRPEWCGVHPGTGEIYFTMTNNSSRRVGATGSQVEVDAANPRAYSDIRGIGTLQQGNVHGHIIRIREDGGAANALTFTWDVYVFGAEAGSTPAAMNISGLTDDNDFSSPDGLVFSASTGICWIQTDDGAYTDVTNCMMLAALPGQVGDGRTVTLDYGSKQVQTRAGAMPTTGTLKRFLVGPKDNEITGLCETPDGRVMFVNVQHPGDDTAVANLSNPDLYTSNWPANSGYGAGRRPRSATVMIVKNDGGRIGT